jgi:DNA-binding Xre family transcriptional regulator
VGGEEMNKAKLRSIMALHGNTNKDLAELLGITEQSFSCKLNENGTEFKQGEITKIKDKYNLSPVEVDAIFFD